MEGVIYKLVCKNKAITDIYIGHSNNETSRYRSHKSAFNGSGNGKKCRVYQFIRDNGGWDNWEFIVLERFPFEKVEAFQKEKLWFDQLQPSLNDRSPRGRIISPSQRMKHWRERVGLFECHCGVSVSRCNKARHLKLHN